MRRSTYLLACTSSLAALNFTLAIKAGINADPLIYTLGTGAGVYAYLVGFAAAHRARRLEILRGP